MPLMYPPRPKGQAINVHVSRMLTMYARGWSLEPVDESQRVEAPPKLTAAERDELRAVLRESVAEMEKLAGDERDAIRGGSTYEPPKPKRRRKRKDSET